jgi:hypothetical protein
VSRILAYFVLAGATLAMPPYARGGFTTPPLILSEASGAEAGGQHSVSLRGTFDFENAVQLTGYPISLIVFQGTTFARYPFTGAPVVGTSAVLADGILTEAEVASLGPGTPAPTGVHIIDLESDTIRVTLPPTFTAGSATAMVIAILVDGTVVSNPIVFSLP